MSSRGGGLDTRMPRFGIDLHICNEPSKTRRREKNLLWIYISPALLSLLVKTGSDQQHIPSGGGVTSLKAIRSTLEGLL